MSRKSKILKRVGLWIDEHDAPYDACQHLAKRLGWNGKCITYEDCNKPRHDWDYDYSPSRARDFASINLYLTYKTSVLSAIAYLQSKVADGYTVCFDTFGSLGMVRGQPSLKRSLTNDFGLWGYDGSFPTSYQWESLIDEIATDYEK